MERKLLGVGTAYPDERVLIHMFSWNESQPSGLPSPARQKPSDSDYTLSLQNSMLPCFSS